MNLGEGGINVTKRGRVADDIVYFHLYIVVNSVVQGPQEVDQISQ